MVIAELDWFNYAVGVYLVNFSLVANCQKAVASHLLLLQQHFLYESRYSSKVINVRHTESNRVVVRHVTGNDKDYLRKIPRVVW